MIQIKKNEWKEPTEIREEVVQAICDAFLNGYKRTFHPHNDNNKGYRNATLFVVYDNRECTSKVPYFWNRIESYQDGFRIRKVEMKRAFSELQKAGYYMLRVKEYGTWDGYICSKKPYDIFYKEAQIVTVFNDYID